MCLKFFVFQFILRSLLSFFHYLFSSKDPKPLWSHWYMYNKMHVASSPANDAFTMHPKSDRRITVDRRWNHYFSEQGKQKTNRRITSLTCNFIPIFEWPKRWLHNINQIALFIEMMNVINYSFSDTIQSTVAAVPKCVSSVWCDKQIGTVFERIIIWIIIHKSTSISILHFIEMSNTYTHWGWNLMGYQNRILCFWFVHSFWTLDIIE